jgi:hypothetical protein
MALHHPGELPPDHHKAGVPVLEGGQAPDGIPHAVHTGQKVVGGKLEHDHVPGYPHAGEGEQAGEMDQAHGPAMGGAAGHEHGEPMHANEHDSKDGTCEP